MCSSIRAHRRLILKLNAAKGQQPPPYAGNDSATIHSQPSELAHGHDLKQWRRIFLATNSINALLLVIKIIVHYSYASSDRIRGSVMAFYFT